MLAVLKSLYFRGVIYMNLMGMTLKQAFFKKTVLGENKVMPKSITFQARMVGVFLLRMWKNNVYVYRACRKVIEEILSGGIREVALCGVNDATKILCILLRERRVRVAGVYTQSALVGNLKFCKVQPLKAIKGYRGKVIMASFVKVKEKLKVLSDLGIEKCNILRLL